MRSRYMTLIISFLLMINVFSMSAYATTYVAHNNDTINNVLENCSPGDTVYVMSGNYTGYVEMFKQNVTLIGDKDARVDSIHIFASGVTVSGFNVVEEGIFLVDSISECNINNNTITNSPYGVVISPTCSHNYINDNVLSNNIVGIQMDECYYNEISRNVITQSSTAIQSTDIYNSFIYKNNINNNLYGISLNGECGNNLIISNEIKFNKNIGVIFNPSFDNSISDNRIYNNYFNNVNNTLFYKKTVDTFNSTIINDKNIIGRSKVSGNYWGTPSKTGFSDVNWDNNSDGFCDQDFIVNGNNVDYNPLTNNIGASADTRYDVAVPDNNEDKKASHSSGGNSKHSSGGSVGVSPEDQKNVAHKELLKFYITTNKKLVINSKVNSTNITGITFNVTKNFGTQTIIFEDLKGKSRLTKVTPDGNVIGYFNIWVGKTAQINKDTIVGGLVYFRLPNDVVEQYDIKVSKYSGNRWISLPTTEIDKHDGFTYYKVNTNFFGNFVITGTEIACIVSEEPKEIVNNVTNNTVDKKPKFDLFNWLHNIWN